MAEVSFYQLSRDPIERVVPLLAAKALDRGGRLVVVHGDEQQRAELSDALWGKEDAFLPNGLSGAPHADRQPILLADRFDIANGATIGILADGVWREDAAQLERSMLLFGPEQTEAARALWGTLSSSGHALRIFKQSDSGAWREGR